MYTEIHAITRRESSTVWTVTLFARIGVPTGFAGSSELSAGTVIAFGTDHMERGSVTFATSLRKQSMIRSHAIAALIGPDAVETAH
jgi:hypothetical protein